MLEASRRPLLLRAALLRNVLHLGEPRSCASRCAGARCRPRCLLSFLASRGCPAAPLSSPLWREAALLAFRPRAAAAPSPASLCSACAAEDRACLGSCSWARWRRTPPAASSRLRRKAPPAHCRWRPARCRAPAPCAIAAEGGIRLRSPSSRTRRKVPPASRRQGALRRWSPPAFRTCAAVGGTRPRSSSLTSRSDVGDVLSPLLAAAASQCCRVSLENVLLAGALAAIARKDGSAGPTPRARVRRLSDPDAVGRVPPPLARRLPDGRQRGPPHAPRRRQVHLVPSSMRRPSSVTISPRSPPKMS